MPEKGMPTRSFTQRAMDCIRAVPRGRVCTYGGIARLAGNARAARQVVRVLHSCSASRDLPWQRIVDRAGRISLPPGRGGDEQRRLLEREGVRFDADGRIDLERFLWRPDAATLRDLREGGPAPDRGA